MTVGFFDLTRQNNLLRSEINHAVDKVIDSGRYILGENVNALEKEFSSFCQTKYAIGVASGTDALHLALRAAGVGKGDEVITSPFTFVATAEAIEYCGATPVFIDIELNTFNLNAEITAKKISKKTKAILPVHLYGQTADMSVFGAIITKYGIPMVEDCAQSIGATFNSRQCGSFGLAGCFSFFPTKNLGCFGDGGMVTTNDETVANEIRVLRGHGSRVTYHYDLIGYNSRLDEIQAAILRVKFPHLLKYAEMRRSNASLYIKHLSGIPGLKLPTELPGAKHVYNQFTIRVKERDALFDHLKKQGIGSMVYYPLSLHLQKAFQSLGYRKGDFPEAEKAQDEVLSLPIFPELKEEEILEVCSAVKGYYAAR